MLASAPLLLPSDLSDHLILLRTLRTLDVIRVLPIYNVQASLMEAVLTEEVHSR